MDLFRNISQKVTISYACVLSTEILLSQFPEKSTALIWLESVSTPRIVSHGAIPIVAWMSSVHHAIGLYGAAAAGILNERRLHTKFRVSFDLGLTELDPKVTVVL